PSKTSAASRAASRLDDVMEGERASASERLTLLDARAPPLERAQASRMSIPEVDAVLSLARGPRLEAPFEHDAYRAVFARARGAAPDVLDAIVRSLSPALAFPDVDHAACVALAVGTLVEQ